MPSLALPEQMLGERQDDLCCDVGEFFRQLGLSRCEPFPYESCREGGKGHDGIM